MSAKRSPSRWVTGLGVLLAALSSIATSRPVIGRNYPMWEARHPAQRTLGCATLRAWVSKSGKEGIGVSVDVSATTSACTLTISDASMRAEKSTHAGVRPAPIALAEGETRQLYIPFEFDNEHSWNAGVREGEITFSLQAGDYADDWTMPVVHRFDGFHRPDVLRATPQPSAKIMDQAAP